ncbi:DUF2225 domain-containing protein [Companilactobacillus kedongensis]|uniref:DUF2225 domain-containing protein n=1 Tax=Companilactobacillus kedongensis TaxID=2486004 RepID=UPI000F79E083|nr:DUF2225 domain-containing protein [Companilactobacillus kedongensis]
MDQLSLDSNYQMSSIKDFNKQIDSLCNNHDYAKLKDFLLSEKTIENISTDRQTQAYYYYLGVAYLQTDNNLDQAEYNFKLAFSSHDNSNVLNTLDRLILISMAAIYAKKNNEKKTLDYITQAFDKFTSTKFETNQIALFYLTAYANLILEKNLDAINWVNQGIDFAAKNDSHYMLANLYYLLAQLLNKTDKSNLALDPHNRAKIFTDLFNEKIFKLD